MTHDDACVGDMVAAGEAQPATLKEVAGVSQRPGAMFGLTDLGLLPQNLVTLRQKRLPYVEVAYTAFCDQVEARFSEEDRLAFGWSMVTAEGALNGIHLLWQEIVDLQLPE